MEMRVRLSALILTKRISSFEETEKKGAYESDRVGVYEGESAVASRNFVKINLSFEETEKRVPQRPRLRFPAVVMIN